VAHQYAGVENLSLIPGTVGAAPIQNIGAYGVEVKDVIESVRYWNIADRSIAVLYNPDCRFAYRDSIFKQELKGNFIIIDVVFKLSKTPNFNLSYGNIRQELERMGITSLNIQAVSDAVIQIRRSKLPDPAVVGNAGSFFKNPEIAISQYKSLLEAFPDMPGYPVGDSNMKIPAGWLIEQCGWKGYRRDNYGVHPLQALVLVNYGGATGKEIYNLSTEIMQSVEEKFGIQLSREVQVVG
jgi:UDP-N-acetylmuramate dehydrogenase